MQLGRIIGLDDTQTRQRIEEWARRTGVAFHGRIRDTEQRSFATASQENFYDQLEKGFECSGGLVEVAVKVQTFLPTAIQAQLRLYIDDEIVDTAGDLGEEVDRVPLEFVGKLNAGKIDRDWETTRTLKALL